MDRSDAIRLARQLRKNSTKAEKSMWFQLRKRRFHNLKFTRQFPIEWKVDSEKSNFFIVDFHCHQYKLVIELDGKYHNKEEVKLRDQERSEILRGMGYNIIRFKNEVVETDIESAKLRLWKFKSSIKTPPY